jgi:hypothetical protein
VTRNPVGHGVAQLLRFAGLEARACAFAVVILAGKTSHPRGETRRHAEPTVDIVER